MLIVDDDTDLAALIGSVAREAGHTVEALHDGIAAREALVERHRDILIVDWLLPGIQGTELVRWLRGRVNDPYTYVILITVRTARRDHLVALEAGADDFITKPVDMEILEARLHVAERILRLQQRLSLIGKIIPICMYCHQIRDEKQQWTRLEQYITNHTHAAFSHTYCPKCYRLHAP